MPDDSVWREEAARKGLSAEFVGRLEASTSVTEAEKARIVGSVVKGSDLGGTTVLREREFAADRPDQNVLRTKTKTREEWVAQGRALGEHEAKSRRETGADAEQRARRAAAYAAWEWDGKPAGQGAKYREEFGILEIILMPSMDRPASEPPKQPS